MVSKTWGSRYLISGTPLFSEWSDNSLYHFEAPHPEGPFEPSRDGAIVQGSGAMGLYGVQLVKIEDADDDFDVIGWFVKRNTLNYILTLK